MHNERHHVVTWRSPLNTLSYNKSVFMQHNSTVTNDVLIIGLQINCIYVMINAISSWLIILIMMKYCNCQKMLEPLRSTISILIMPVWC